MDKYTSKNIDPRSQKTKQAIQNAFNEMVCEGELKDITVKKLAERANIHRKTFYLHYACIEALYEDILNSIAEEYFEAVDKLPLPYSYYDLTKILFESYCKNKFTERLLCHPTYSGFTDRLIAAALKHNRTAFNPFSGYSEDEQSLIFTFIISPSIDMLRQWINDGKKIPQERAIELISRLLENGVSCL